MSDANKKENDSQDQKTDTGLTVVIENFTQEMLDAVLADHALRADGSSMTQLLLAFQGALRGSDRKKTRLVITGDIVASVSDREDRSSKPYTTERGGGVVAAKTMPPDEAGFVDVLVPSYWFAPSNDVHELSERDAYIQHIAAHEAIHVSIFHIGDEAFDVHLREDFAYAMKNFISMASEQAEEHLAEFLGSKVSGRKLTRSAEQVSLSIEAWRSTIDNELPAIPESDPEYFQRGMLVTFEALHILWKSLAYLAAALRTERGFEPVPIEIAMLPTWKEYVEPWWTRYLDLLGEIPMDVEVDIQATDKVIRHIAKLLQLWADEIGFDFHDTDQGGYFRIKIWD